MAANKYDSDIYS